MANLGLSPTAIQSILQKENWVTIYRNELIERTSNLSEINFPAERFKDSIKPSLEKALQKELSESPDKINIRESIRRWMVISHNKSALLIKFLDLIPKELSESKKIIAHFKDVPIGPQDSDVVEQMNENDRKRWHEGSIAFYFAGLSANNIVGLFVSELFFTIEAMCRVICIGSCLEFAIKTVLPTTTIQHDEIYKTLNRLSREANSKVTCKLCPINEDCSRLDSYSKLASIYELLYHLRVIKDYRLEFYFESQLTEFLIGEYLAKGFEITLLFDKIMDRLFHSYLRAPISVADQKEKILKILKQLKPKL